MSTQRQRETIGVLLSGGLDSSILLGRLLDEGRRVQPFFVRCHLPWEPAELAAVQRFLTAISCERLHSLVTLDLPVGDLYSQHWSVTGKDIPGGNSPDEAVFLPGRNALLIIKAAIWCQLHGIEELALATLESNPFADATVEFFRNFEAALNQGVSRPVRILRPFAHLSKTEVMKLGGRYPLQHTFSCISPRDELHCGCCNKCAERREAFRAAQLPDPTPYHSDE